MRFVILMLFLIGLINGQYNGYSVSIQEIEKDMQFVSQYTGINKKYLKAIAIVESNMNPYAVNVNMIVRKEINANDLIKIVSTMKKYKQNHKMKLTIHNKSIEYDYNDISLLSKLRKLNGNLIVSTNNSIGFDLPTLQDANAFVKTISDIYTNLDIGLMQINYDVWLKNKNLPPQMLFDPLTSLYLASYILLHNLQIVQNIQDAVRVYHSWNKDRGNTYIARINDVLGGVHD
jgi:hypothetical protein